MAMKRFFVYKKLHSVMQFDDVSQKEEAVFEDGEVIVSEGDETREMYIIREGGAQVTKLINNEQVILGELGRGEFFGEMSLMESLPRAATVRASGKTRLIILHAGGFLLKLRRDPTFAFEVVQQLCRRTRSQNDTIKELIEKNAMTEQALEELIASPVIAKECV